MDGLVLSNSKKRTKHFAEFSESKEKEKEKQKIIPGKREWEGLQIYLLWQGF